MSERRYRGKQSRPIPVWNGVLEHRARIDSAIWEFLWLLDAITEERDGVGIVLGGAPVKAKRIAQELDFDEWTVRQHLEALENGRYIRRRRTAYGHVVEVCNSRKFGIWKGVTRSGEMPRSERKRSGVLQPEIGGKPPIRSGEMPRNKEDAAVTQQKDAASSHATAKPNPEDSVWGFLEISPCGPLRFRDFLEGRWASRNGEPRSVLIGKTVDAWEASQGNERLRGGAPLFRALDKLRKSERQKSQPAAEVSAPIHTFSPEEIPA